MSYGVLETEMLRGRWRRYRQGLNLLDPTSEDFSTGGLVRRVTDSSVRLLVLPGDPEAGWIDFDGEFWSWWLEERESPVTGKQTRWGTQSQPTSTAAVRYLSRGRVEDWESYLALHRHGGLEMELGEHAIYSWDGRRAFRLIFTVGHLWSALDLYREVVEWLDVRGPWEISLALRNTRGALLGNVGTGWVELGQGFADEIPVCEEQNLLARREFEAWPDAGGVESLAFGLGGWIEDSWGVYQRRFLARQGDHSGQFDVSRYGE